MQLHHTGVKRLAHIPNVSSKVKVCCRTQCMSALSIPGVSMSVCTSFTLAIFSAVDVSINQQAANLNTCRAGHASNLLHSSPEVTSPYIAPGGLDLRFVSVRSRDTKLVNFVTSSNSGSSSLYVMLKLVKPSKHMIQPLGMLTLHIKSCSFVRRLRCS